MQWLSGLYYADFISFYSPTQLDHSSFCFRRPRRNRPARKAIAPVTKWVVSAVPVFGSRASEWRWHSSSLAGIIEEDRFHESLVSELRDTDSLEVTTLLDDSITNWDWLSDWEALIVSEAEAESNKDNDAEFEANSEIKMDSEVLSETEAEARTDSTIDSETDKDSETLSENDALLDSDVETDSKVEIETESEPLTESETLADAE